MSESGAGRRKEAVVSMMSAFRLPEDFAILLYPERELCSIRAGTEMSESGAVRGLCLTIPLSPPE